MVRVLLRSLRDLHRKRRHCGVAFLATLGLRVRSQAWALQPLAAKVNDHYRGISDDAMLSLIAMGMPVYSRCGAYRCSLSRTSRRFCNRLYRLDSAGTESICGVAERCGAVVSLRCTYWHAVKSMSSSYTRQ